MDDFMHETSDLTIDLDDCDSTEIFEKDLITTEDSYVEFDDGQVIIDPPITVNSVRINVPQETRIRNLADSVINIIVMHLDIPPYLSVANWVDIANFFHVPTSEIVKIENGPRPIERLIAYLSGYPAQKLFDSLEHACRVDILFLIKRNYEKYGILACESLESGLQTATTSYAATNFNTTSIISPRRSVRFQNAILINHYETTNEEKKDFKWFMKNMRNNLASVTDNIFPLDICELEKDDGGNLIERLHEALSEVPQIVVCYNASFLEAITSKADDPSFKNRKYIHQQTIIEFFANNMKNKRCRCVLMPGDTKTEAAGWAPATIQYKFPENLHGLVERIRRVDMSNPNTL